MSNRQLARDMQTEFQARVSLPLLISLVAHAANG